LTHVNVAFKIRMLDLIMLFFAVHESRAFGEQMARHLGVDLSPHEERSFEDGEHKIRPLVSVRGKDVYVLQSLHGGPVESVNDKLCKLLFFLSALRDNGAARITALVPYLAYSRKDRQTKTRDPVTTQYVARLFEAAGVDCVVTLDVHNIVAFQNAFRCRTIHLDTRRLFASELRNLLAAGPITVISPDPGGVKRAQLFREMLQKILLRPVGQAFVDKRRSAGVVSGDMMVGDVERTTVVVIDDLIASGGTMDRAAHAALEHGAKEVIACAAHGLFTGDAKSTLAAAPLQHIIVTDTVPPFRLDAKFVTTHVKIVSAVPLFADCIKCLHGGSSISQLLGDED
jgi:ribose-phosphate pyrophosphokinase